jgi:hypothetical protein
VPEQAEHFDRVMTGLAVADLGFLAAVGNYGPTEIRTQPTRFEGAPIP